MLAHAHTNVHNTEIKLMEQVLARILLPGDAASMDPETQMQIARLAASMVQGANTPAQAVPAQQTSWNQIQQHAVQQQQHQDMLAALLRAAMPQQQPAFVNPNVFAPSQTLPPHLVQHLMQAVAQGQQVPSVFGGGQAVPGYAGMMAPTSTPPAVGQESPTNGRKSTPSRR